jgi:hypothetical protein
MTQKLNRIMKDVFHDGQSSLHEVKGNQWISIYNKQKNIIVFDNVEYYSLNNFTKNHYKITSPYRIPENKAWAESNCLIDDIWVLTYNLPVLSDANK